MDTAGTRTTAPPPVTRLETRSIDYVPVAERHGKVWHLGPLWFAGNAQLATLVIGASAVSGVLPGALGAAYACHVDRGPALHHGHRAAVHAWRSHTRRTVPVHPRCGPCQ